MKVEVNLKKNYLLSFVLVALVVFGIVGVIAFGTSSPSAFGHSVGEIDWNGVISGNVKASGFCIGTDCRTSWTSGSTTSGTSGLIAGSGISITTLSNGDVVINATNTGTSGSGQWTTSGSNIYYSGGNVGIGVSNPSAALDVAGNARVSGSLNVSGNVILPGNYKLYRVTNNYCSEGVGSLSSYGNCTTRPYAYTYNATTNVYGPKYFDCTGASANALSPKYCANTLI